MEELSQELSKGNPSDFGKYNDMYKKRKALVEEAKRLGKDAIAYVAEKEGITVQGAQRYLSNKGFWTTRVLVPQSPDTPWTSIVTMR